MRNEECIEFPVNQSTITHRYTDEAIKFITESTTQQKPFFLFLNHSMPHTPLFTSPDFAGASVRGLYGDVIQEIDFNVGRVLKELKKQGIDENTIVIFTSDNGPWLIKKKHGGSALPFFEGKMTQFEGGQRVPAIVRWLTKIPANSACNEIITSMDFLPTLTTIANANIPKSLDLDGKNVLNLFQKVPGATTPHEYFYYGKTAVRSGDWKYHSREVFKIKKTKRDTKKPTLYNLKEDPSESVNKIEAYPEIAARLQKALKQHIARIKKK